MLLSDSNRLTANPSVTQLTTSQNSTLTIHQKSVLMRLSGDVMGSMKTIQGFLSDTELPTDELATLHLSQANNHMYRFEFKDAHNEIQKWKPSRISVSDYLLWDQMICASRALKGTGEFHAAKIALEKCLATPGLPKHKRCLAVSMFSDVLCELWAMESDTSFLLRAETLVRSELQHFRERLGPYPKGFRRLLLALLENLVCQNLTNEAASVSNELLAIYKSLGELDIIDRLGHVRTLIAQARLAHTPTDAVPRWLDVLRWNRHYNPYEEEVFTCGVVYLALANRWCELEQQSIASTYFQRSAQVLAHKRRQFLIPGLGTYILCEIRTSCHPLLAISATLIAVA
ncbi:hypothetical protein NW762_012837 [Fusarium torreyae]|uniref:Uncharacterized protein n=1 Tax=Fusarium torreyae TaxID=1237075 RepID=A0A9W8RQS4_9HYPO|nr:hypothetical protein NW762_012837 [Fusarium torreyae]